MTGRIDDVTLGAMVEHAREAHGNDVYYEVAPNAFLAIAEELIGLRAQAQGGGRPELRMLDGFQRWKRGDLNTEELEGLFHELLYQHCAAHTPEPPEDTWFSAKTAPPPRDTDVRFRVGAAMFIGRPVRLSYGTFMRSHDSGDFALSIVKWQPLPTPPEAP